MKYLKIFIVSAPLILYLSGCSTVSINKRAPDLSSITAYRTYQVRVRSGNLAMDRLIYNVASTEFGRYLRMSGERPSNSFVDIVFASKSKKVFSGLTDSYTKNVYYGDSWYTGSETVGTDSIYRSNDSEIAPGDSFTWQNSAMTVTIRDMEGKILWRAEYNYKGAFEFAWLYVNSADEAARFSLDVILKQFEKDFVVIPARGDKIVNRKPGIALVVEKQDIPVPQAPRVTEETYPDGK